MLSATWRDPRLAFDPGVTGTSEEVYQGDSFE